MKSWNSPEPVKFCSPNCFEFPIGFIYYLGWCRTERVKVNIVSTLDYSAVQD